MTKKSLAGQSITVGGITITFDPQAEAFLTLEVVLTIAAALVPFGILPLWLVTILPILRADLPVAELLLIEIEAWFKARQKAGASPEQMIGELRDWLTQPADANPSYPWT